MRVLHCPALFGSGLVDVTLKGSTFLFSRRVSNVDSKCFCAKPKEFAVSRPF